MKKIFLFVFISLITLVGLGQSTFKRGIKVGITDSTAVIDSITKYGNIFKAYSGNTRIYDDTLLTGAALINDVVPVWADTATYMATKTDLQDIIGSGGGGKFYYLSGITGVTEGLPGNGDSLVLHTNFIGKKVTFFREGNLQQRHTDNTGSDGYWFDNITGKITVKPIFADGEQVEVWATNTILWESLIAEGGGGGGGDPPATPLLDSLLAVYEMDEVLGTAVIDIYGGNNGVTNAVNDAVGKIGRSKIFGGLSYIEIPNNASLIPPGDEFSFSCWFYITTLPSVAGHNEYLLRLRHATTPYYCVTIFMHTTDYISFYVSNTTGTTYEYETAASAVSAGQWYHLVCVNEGAGEDAKIYLNNVDITSYHPTAFTGTLLQYNSVLMVGNHNKVDEYGFKGYLDQSILYKQALTPADVSWLWNDGNGRAYPFN